MNNILKKIKNNPEKIVFGLQKLGLLRWISDKQYIKMTYRLTFGKKLDLENPKTFNEKLQWLKLNDRKDLYTTLVDKAEVKDYISKKIGNQYVVPTVGIYDNVEEIDFSKLPNEYIIKTTHDSGSAILVNDNKNVDIELIKKSINKSLNNNFYERCREWPYKNVKPRIIVEELLYDEKVKEVRDYKFFCFNGIVKFFKIDFDRQTNHRANYYDLSGNMLDFGEKICPPDPNRNIEMPHNLKKMIQLSKKISSGISFVRVDLYEVNDKIYFGEITFFPNGGFGKFIPEKYDKIIGDYLSLDIKNRR